MKTFLVLAAVIAMGFTASAEELSKEEAAKITTSNLLLQNARLAVENARLAQENAQLRHNSLTQDVRAHHKLADGDDWDEKGEIHRAPVKAPATDKKAKSK